MKLVMFGAPGSGKGTQAERLSAKYDIPQISTGEIFRALKRGEQVPGMTLSQEVVDQIATLINSGALVPDELTCDLVMDRIQQDYADISYLQREDYEIKSVYTQREI